MSRATLYLVRHAKAGDRRAWPGDDVDRPLNDSGRRQAESIGTRLAEHGAAAAIASPSARCVQTLEPLARWIGVEVLTDDRLLEGAGFEGVLDLVADAEPGAVLCSHGDVIPAVVRALERRGMRVQTPADWRKASIWVLSRRGSLVTNGMVWPPPKSGSAD